MGEWTFMWPHYLTNHQLLLLYPHFPVSFVAPDSEGWGNGVVRAQCLWGTVLFTWLGENCDLLQTSLVQQFPWSLYKTCGKLLKWKAPRKLRTSTGNGDEKNVKGDNTSWRRGSSTLSLSGRWLGLRVDVLEKSRAGYGSLSPHASRQNVKSPQQGWWRSLTRKFKSGFRKRIPFANTARQVN